MGADVAAKNTCVPLSELMTVDIRSTSVGVPCLYAHVESANREAAAMSIACSIARGIIYQITRLPLKTLDSALVFV